MENLFFVAHEVDAFGNATVCIAHSLSAFAPTHGDPTVAESHDDALRIAGDLRDVLESFDLGCWIDDTTEAA